MKAPASIAYNRNISLQTTKWAIVDWLRDEHRHGIWRVSDFFEAINILLTGRHTGRTSLHLILLFTRTKYARSKTLLSRIRYNSYAYCRILYWAKDDKSFRSYVASTDSYGYNSHQRVQAAQKTKNGLDLLEEFDKGMKVIESWKVGDEAE